MGKKYIEVKLNDKVVAVCPLKECDPLAYLELEKAAKENAKDAEATIFNAIESLTARIKELEKEVRILKGED